MARADGGESVPVPVICRIIDVKNILETLINVGRDDDKRGTAVTRQVAIGFQLENDYSCRVTVAATSARLSPWQRTPFLFRVALSRAGSTIAQKGDLHFSSFTPSSLLFSFL